MTFKWLSFWVKGSFNGQATGLTAFISAPRVVLVWDGLACCIIFIQYYIYLITIQL